MATRNVKCSGYYIDRIQTVPEMGIFFSTVVSPYYLLLCNLAEINLAY